MNFYIFLLSFLFLLLLPSPPLPPPPLLLSILRLLLSLLFLLIVLFFVSCLFFFLFFLTIFFSALQYLRNINKKNSHVSQIKNIDPIICYVFCKISQFKSRSTRILALCSARYIVTVIVCHSYSHICSP